MTGIVDGNAGVPPSGSGHSAEPEPSFTVSAVPVSVPNAERLKLDRRIHAQRVALRENWMIVDQRQNGHRHFTLSVIRELVRLCDLLDVPKKTPDGFGTYTLLHRAQLAASAIEARRAATAETGAVHESAVAKPDAQGTQHD